MKQVIPESDSKICGSCGEDYLPKNGHSCRPELPKKNVEKKKNIKVRTKTPLTDPINLNAINSLNDLSTKYWVEFKQALVKDLPPFMLPNQRDHIVQSHKAAFDMGCMSILDGIKLVAEERKKQC